METKCGLDGFEAVMERLHGVHKASFAEDSPTAASALPVSDHARGNAAVLVALFPSPDGDVQVLLTLRSAQLRSHANEVALPGGKFDMEDGNLVRTATREAFEEIGLPPDMVQPVCVLDAAISKHGLLVLPVVAKVPATFRPVVNEDEVAAVFSCPLKKFLSDDGHMFRDITYGDYPFRLHFFSVADTASGRKFTVWGMTAGILIRVAATCFDREPAFEVHCPGCPGRTAVISSQLRSEQPPPTAPQILSKPVLSPERCVSRADTSPVAVGTPCVSPPPPKPVVVMSKL